MSSDPNPLHIVKANSVMSPIIELSSASAGMIGHDRGILQRATIFQIGRNPCRPKTVIANLRFDVGRGSSPGDHRIGIGLG